MKVSCDTKGIQIMNKGNKLANASIILDDAFVVRNLSVMNGSKGIFVSFPSQRGLDKDGNEKYYDTAFPLSADLRSEINNVVLDAYFEKLNELQQGARNRSNSEANQDNQSSNQHDESAEEEFYPF